MLHKISKKELFHAQLVLFAAIALQVVVWSISAELTVSSHYTIILTEIVLAVLIGFTATLHGARRRWLHHLAAIGLMGLISAANVTSLILVVHALLTGNSAASGAQLLTSAVAIFMTNIIVFALWYWEIDSPGLSRSRWSRDEQDFRFTQQETPNQYPDWQPTFADYLYVSITNAINFAPSDTRPLSHMAKFLMGSQALISIFTLALVIARAVSILG